ncbi:hypothetical protein D9619_006889 [Psilocybe cf. subviscida]|uniref:F-box domain-containing protein n=1 Tax=Psilocybe cf. subviscida TaxID=2480587 RepID=A0A8H5B675_9AGAR|nr:hypothetical protein D9619_006889 [Psilocybe cf. subviscida]
MTEQVLNPSRGVPSDDEIALVRQVFRHPLSRLEQIDKLQSELQEAIQKLEDEKRTLTNHFAVYLNIVSPMSRLPEDILRDIFILCLPHERQATMSNTEAPILLTQVTSRWREVAVTTPRLWASIHIVIPSTAPAFDSAYDSATGARISLMEVAKMRAVAVADWLAKSGSLPLDISLFEQDVYPRSEYAAYIVPILLPFAKRWQKLKLDVPASSVEEIKALLPADTPILQSIDVHPHRDAPVSSTNWGNGALFGAPSLRNVSVLGIQGIKRLPIRWSSLTNLVIDAEWWNTRETVTMSDLIVLLEQCQQLKSCKLKVNTDDAVTFPPDSDGKPKRVYLPTLESLYLLEAGRNATYGTLFDAPNLRSLEYYHASSRTQNGEQVRKFLSTPGMQIEELSVAPRACGGSIVDDWLAHCQGLKTLNIKPFATGGAIEHTDDKPTEVSNLLLLKLAPLAVPNQSDQEGCLCPQLDTLHVTSNVHFSEDAVIDFVKRKMSGQYPHLSKLKSLRVAFTHPPPRGNRDYIKTALADVATPESGLKLEIEYPPPMYRGPFSSFDGIPKRDREHPYYQHIWS